MKKIEFKNSLQKGSFRYVVFQDEKVWYAVALECNLVVSSDTPELALYELFEAVKGYVESVKKSKSRVFALNQTIDKEYLDLWERAQSDVVKIKAVKSPYIHSFGVSKSLAA